MANSQNGEKCIPFHSKWFKIVQSISILSISIPNGLKQCNPFLFHFHSIHFHSKCIVNKHSFYLFNSFLPFRMVKIILTKHSFYPFHLFHPFLPFRMVKPILTIPNENNQKWLFQTEPFSQFHEGNLSLYFISKLAFTFVIF